MQYPRFVGELENPMVSREIFPKLSKEELFHVIQGLKSGGADHCYGITMSMSSRRAWDEGNSLTG